MAILASAAVLPIYDNEKNLAQNGLSAELTVPHSQPPSTPYQDSTGRPGRAGPARLDLGPPPDDCRGGRGLGGGAAWGRCRRAGASQGPPSPHSSFTSAIMSAWRDSPGPARIPAT
jgi:hypothetical protein